MLLLRINRLITMDLHADRFKVFDVPVDHLYASGVFVDYLKQLKESGNMVIATPMWEGPNGLVLIQSFWSARWLSVKIHRKRMRSQTYIIGDVEDGCSVN